MTAPIQPNPIDLLPEGPRPIDTEEQFNAKSFATIEAQEAMIPQLNAAIAAAFQNAVAAYEAALAAGESKDQAAESALAAFNEAARSHIEANRSEAGAASAWAAAAAAGAAAGLPSMAGKAGMSLTVNAAGNGVEWKAAGLEVGGVYVGAKKPTLGAWLDTDAVYLQSSYPVLFAALGLVPGEAPWTQRTPAAITAIRDVAEGNGMYVAVGTNASSAYVGASSPNGTAWTARTVAAGEAVTFGNGVFVAVGTNVAASSVDGVTWTSRTIANAGWRSVTYAAGLFVAIATGGQIATSPDGTTWTLRTSALTNGQAVTYGDGRFVAFSQSGQAAFSVNGITWTTLNSIVGLGTVYALVYGSGMWVAVGVRGVMTSPNLITWTARYIPGVSASYGYTAVDFYNGRFIAVGATASGNEVFSDSPDGVSWTPRHIPTGAYAVIRAMSGLLIAAGTVMQTAPMFPYNTATQFYVPAPLGVVGLKSWMKAGD